MTAPASTPTLLEVDDLTVRFLTPRGVVHAVDGVSLRLGAGEVLGVVGESGSGKTVMARRVMGLIGASRTTEVSGSIRLDGTEISEMSAKQLSRYWGTEMAMVLQDPMTSLNPVKRVGYQITESILHHLRVSQQEAQRRAVDLLRSVGLSEPERRVRQYPHELSGGMRQRVTIAIALACQPRILFADEPTTALDVTVQAQILDLLTRLQHDTHMAMIMVTHDLRVVRGRSDRIAVMYGGKIVETAPTPVLFDAPRMPYTEALMNAVPPLSGPGHIRLRDIPGRPPDLINAPAGCRFSPRCPYAQERCLSEDPPLTAPESLDHQFRCWYPIGSAEWEEAREHNLRRGESAAGTPVSEQEVTVS